MTFLIYSYIFIFGLIIGSFLNALIWRLHSGESMMERSRCTDCHESIKWYDNIPVVSYLVLGGKCRKCKKSISWQYPVVEIVTGVLFLITAQAGNQNFFILSTIYFLLKSWFVIAVMIIVFIYDLRWYLILDKVTLPAGLILFLMWFFENWSAGYLSNFNNTWLGLIFSVLIGGGFFGLQYIISMVRWIGLGDVKLGVVMGLALGVSGVIGAIFIAYIIGAIVGVGLIAAGKKELGSKLPFGTCLSVSTVVMMLWGAEIINWYMKIIGV